MKTYRFCALLFTFTGPWQAMALRQHTWSTFDEVETPTSGTLSLWFPAVFEAYYRSAC